MILIPAGAGWRVRSITIPRHCENCHVGEIVPDDAVISAISEGVRGYALDLARADALWAKSEAMVGERF